MNLSLGTAISGLILGSLGALLALGMALVYRANRIVTFTQTDLGVLPATAAVLVMDKAVWGFSFWLALPLGLLAAAVVGAIVELAFIRRFSKSPRLMGTVATIGVSQLLGFASLELPKAWGLIPTLRTFDPPFSFRLVIGERVFDANDLLGAVVAPVAIAALVVFLRSSRTGVAIRAAAERPDRASMLGVPVKRLQTEVWAIAAVLSFVGVFFTAGITGLAPGLLLSSLLLLRALAAMVIGRMTDLVVIATASVGLGLVESVLKANDLELAVSPVLVGVILVTLVLRRHGRTRADDAQSAWHIAAEFRSIPRSLRRLPEVRVTRAAAAMVTAAAVVVLPHLLGTAGTLKAGAVLIFATIGLSMVVLSGWAGQVSLGQMAFVGVGGAVTAWATVTEGMDPLVAFVLSGLAGALVATIVGLPALRLGGVNLAVVTFGLALAASAAAFSPGFYAAIGVADWIPRGAFDRPPLLSRISIDSPIRLYYLALGVLLLAVVAVRGLRRSRFGRVLIAQRENERAAMAYGVSVVRTKLAAFALSGFIAASAGSIFAFHQAAFRTENYGVGESLGVFVAAVIGGLGTPLGAVLGAVYIRGAQWVLRGDWQVLASSVGVLLVLMVMPDGLSGLWFRVRDAALRLVADRRGIVVPSLNRVARAGDDPASESEPDPEPEDVVV